MFFLKSVTDAVHQSLASEPAPPAPSDNDPNGLGEGGLAEDMTPMVAFQREHRRTPQGTYIYMYM